MTSTAIEVQWHNVFCLLRSFRYDPSCSSVSELSAPAKVNIVIGQVYKNSEIYVFMTERAALNMKNKLSEEIVENFKASIRIEKKVGFSHDGGKTINILSDINRHRIIYDDVQDLPAFVQEADRAAKQVTD